MSTYLKYLKYKNKYLTLKMQIAGGISTARKAFIDALFFQEQEIELTPEIKNVIDMNDIEYQKLIAINEGKYYTQLFNKEQQKFIKHQRKIKNKKHAFELFKTNIMNDMHSGFIISADVLHTEESLKNIFSLIEMKIREFFPKDIDNHIDFIIQLYLNNLFGTPSSFTNLILFQELVIKYNKIINNKSFVASTEKFKEFMSTYKSINNFNSLQEFNDYMNSEIINSISTKIDEHIAIQERKLDKKKARAEKLKIYETKPIYESKYIVIYKPTNENEAKFHGQNTKWCTAGDKDNMFDYYSDDGPLYVIQKTDGSSTDKYQLHVASDSFKDSKDDDVDMSEFFRTIIRGDDRGILFIYDIFIKHIIHINETNLNIHMNVFYDFIESVNSLTRIKIDFKKDVTTVITELYKKLDISNDISKITSLYVYNRMDFVFDLLKSVFTEKITQLTMSIRIPYDYKNLILKCINLEKLRVPQCNQVLGDSLSDLRNLKILRLDDYNQPFGDSLSGLINLNTLELEKYNQPLDDSLSGLINLKTIYFGKYNHPLNNSLDNLINLTRLAILDYNFPLDNSLSKLTKLDSLELNNFNHPIGDSLINLTNLNMLYLNKYDGPFGDSLRNNLEISEIYLSPAYVSNYYDDFKKMVVYLRKIEIINIDTDDGKLKLSDELTKRINNRIDRINMKYNRTIYVSII